MKQSEIELPIMLTRKEVMEILGIKSQTTMTKYSKSKCGMSPVLPCIRVGRLMKYRLSDVADFLNRQ